ncbi:MAG: 30S ribosomal protein S8 [Candidatus Diapherotrites archaeon]
MTLFDPISDALVNLKNHERASKNACTIKPASKLLKEILRVLQENGYIEKFEAAQEGSHSVFKIALLGKINDCKSIKPRYAVKKDGFEKFEKRYLPSMDVGILIVSTPKGVVSHKEAKKNGSGGRLLAFVY